MLLKPTIKLSRITELSGSLLNSRGITAIVLDVDNTLSTHHSQTPAEGVEDWLREIRAAGFAPILLSNSRKERVRPFAERLGLPFISLGLKPLPFGYLRAVKRLGGKRRSTAIVGDQIFTDILGGNAAGLKTVLLDPILPETGGGFRFRRRLERIVKKLYRIENTEG